ncbi:hypothetical protein [Georgenia sp. SUBG003]|uniref:hypothetical protein n=1 Tax=Georgenia sp. SUBG003 TaxID=1497974 RepID=UPI003AB7038F
MPTSATPRPRLCPTSSTTRRQGGSPAAAAATTCLDRQALAEGRSEHLQDGGDGREGLEAAAVPAPADGPVRPQRGAATDARGETVEVVTLVPTAGESPVVCLLEWPTPVTTDLVN